MVMAAATQIRGSVAPATARRWAIPPGAALLRFAPLAAVTVPSTLRRGVLGGPSGVAAKSWTTMCVNVKADYASPVDPVTRVEQTGNEVQEPAIVAPNEEASLEQEVAPQQKSAMIHDFCLGIPFGGFLFSMGLIGFLFWRNPVSLTFGVAPGLAILALGVLSLKVWRSGKSSLPFILAQAALAGAVTWKHSQAYMTTKKLLPWGVYAALSAAMICFYSYVLLAGGNPPPKKASAAVA